MESNIIPLQQVKPKTFKFSYKKVPIVLTYQPDIGKWEFDIAIISETHHYDIRSDEKEAIKAAKKYIDKYQLGKE